MQLKFDLSQLPTQLDQLGRDIAQFQSAMGVKDPAAVGLAGNSAFDTAEGLSAEQLTAFDTWVDNLATNYDFEVLLNQLEAHFQLVDQLDPEEKTLKPLYDREQQRRSPRALATAAQYQSEVPCTTSAEILSRGFGLRDIQYCDLGRLGQQEYHVIEQVTPERIAALEDLSTISPLAYMPRADAADRACSAFNTLTTEDNATNKLIKAIINVANPLTSILGVYWSAVLFKQKLEKNSASVTAQMRRNFFIACADLPGQLSELKQNSAKLKELSPVLDASHITKVLPDSNLAPAKVSVLLPARKLSDHERSLLAGTTALDDGKDYVVAPAYHVSPVRLNGTLLIANDLADLRPPRGVDSSLGLEALCNDLRKISVLNAEWFLKPLIKQLADQNLEIKAARYQQINLIQANDGTYRLQVLCQITEISQKDEEHLSASDPEQDKTEQAEKSLRAAPLITVRADYRLDASLNVSKVLAYGIATHAVPSDSVDFGSSWKASDLLSAETQRAYYRAMHTGQSKLAFAIPTMATALVVGALFVFAAFGILPVPDLTTWFRTLDVAFQIVIALFTPLISGLAVGGVFAGIEALFARYKGNTYLDAEDCASVSLTKGMEISDAVKLMTPMPERSLSLSSSGSQPSLTNSESNSSSNSPTASPGTPRRKGDKSDQDPSVLEREASGDAIGSNKTSSSDDSLSDVSGEESNANAQQGKDNDTYAVILKLCGPTSTSKEIEDESEEALAVGTVTPIPIGNLASRNPVADRSAVATTSTKTDNTSVDTNPTSSTTPGSDTDLAHSHHM